MQTIFTATKYLPSASWLPFSGQLGLFSLQIKPRVVLLFQLNICSMFDDIKIRVFCHRFNVPDRCSMVLVYKCTASFSRLYSVALMPQQRSIILQFVPLSRATGGFEDFRKTSVVLLATKLKRYNCSNARYSVYVTEATLGAEQPSVSSTIKFLDGIHMMRLPRGASSQRNLDCNIGLKIAISLSVAVKSPRALGEDDIRSNL